MTELHLRLVPTDPSWQPTPDAARAAVEVLRRLTQDRGEMELELYDEVTLIEQSRDHGSAECPGCRRSLPRSWWHERLDRAAASSYTNLTVVTPCCHTVTSLNDLRHACPTAFTRAELSVRNLERDELNDDELTALAHALGHAIRQLVTDDRPAISWDY